MELGFPVAIPDLPQYATRCYVVRLPDAPRVRILASVVGLAGIPTMRGGWVPTRPGYEPTKEAGFQSLAEDLERTSPQYYVCVRTFSAQGCDALLTVAVSDASEPVPPPIWLRRSYPSVWPLGGSSAMPKSLRFVIQAEYLNAFHVSAVPVSGEADLEIFVAPDDSGPGAAAPDRDGCHGVLLERSALVGPDVIDIPAHKQKRQMWGMEARHNLCIQVSGQGIVSLTAGPRLPGPFLAPFIPAAGRFRAIAAGAQPVCEFFRLLVNDLADMTVTAIAEDNSQLTLAASLTTELFQAPVANRWRGEAPPGGAGAVLVVRRADVAAAAAEAPGQEETCLSITACRLPRVDAAGGGHQGSTRFWVTAVTDSGVLTLEDGLPLATSVPQRAGKQSWRDFRILVPAGAARPREVTITATSTGKAEVVADTVRFPLRPRSYRWAADANSSHAVLRLTTEPELATGGVHLIDCRFPCFVYVSARAYVDGATTGDTDLQLLAASDTGGAVKLLLEGGELEQTLAAGETQIFKYIALRNDSASLFSLGTSDGAANFEVSAAHDFPDDPMVTTRHADDVVLLEPLSEVFRSAVRRARPGAMPAFFVRVRASGTASCTFTVAARAEGDAKVMWNGDEASGAVEANGLDRFRFFIGEHDVQRPVEVSVEVTPLTGRPSAYVACSPNRYPRESDHDWGRRLEGQGSIVFTSASLRFRPGWVYLALSSKERAAFKVRVRWGNTTIELQDGTEEVGHVMAGDTRPYVLAVGDSAPQDRPVVLRAEALVGAFSLCVADLPKDGGARHSGSEVCRHRAVANASTQAESGLISLDLPAEEVRSAGKFLLLVQGLHVASDFALRALVSAPATLAAEHSLVMDSLGPPCCVTGPLGAQLLHRRYLHYTPPEVHSVSIELRALGFGSLKGAALKARQGSARGAASGTWPVVAHADDLQDGASVFKQDVDRRTLNVPAVQQGFWLEIDVEVQSPLNFTLHVGSSSAALLPSLGTRLLPNVLIAGNLTTALPKKYEFDLGRGDAAGAWHLRVQECYGQVSVGLPYAGQEAKRRGGGFAEVALPAPEQQADASSLGTAILEAGASQLPVSYQVELVAPGVERALLLPEKDALTPSMGPGRNLSFLFGAAAAGRAEHHANASLRYTLVALRGGDEHASANTSCGLEEALRRGLALQGSVLEEAAGRRQRGDRLSLVVPLADLSAMNASLEVNVLVELIGADGQRVAARSYSARSASATELGAWATVVAGPSSGGLLPIFFVLVGVGGFWGLANCVGGLCRGAPEPEPFEKDEVELEVQYDLHTDRQAGMYSQRSGYVPPSV